LELGWATAHPNSLYLTSEDGNRIITIALESQWGFQGDVTLSGATARMGEDETNEWLPAAAVDAMKEMGMIDPWIRRAGAIPGSVKA
jgi:hypothetical protein